MRATRLLGCVLVALLAVCSPSLAAPTPTPVAVVPGVAFKAVDGSVTFAGGGFRPLSSVQILVNGMQHSTLTSNDRGGFVTALRLPGVGNQSLAAAGQQRTGRVHVVTATVQTGQVLAPLPPGSMSEGTRARRVFGALGLGLGAVVVTALALLVVRVGRRRRHNGAT